MYKNVLRSIDGIDIFPVIALLIFVVFFIGLLFYVMSMRKGLVDEMSDLPLETSNPSQNHENE